MTLSNFTPHLTRLLKRETRSESVIYATESKQLAALANNSPVAGNPPPPPPPLDVEEAH